MGLPLLRRQADLLRHSGFRLLFLATLGSGVGTWLAFIALQVDVYDRTHSANWVAALLIAELAPTVAVGLLLGPLVDRLSRRWLMIGSDLVRAAVFCALPFAGSAATVVALGFVAGLATAFFRPAVYAGLPNLVPDGQLPQANSLLQFVDAITNSVGPLVGGVLVAAAGPDTAYWINAVTFVVSAALIAGIPGRLLQVTAALSEGHWRDLAAGFALVRRAPALLTVFVAWNIASIATAGVNVSEIVLAKETFDSGDFGFGLMLGTAGAGLAVGSILAGGIVERLGIGRAYGVALGLTAVGIGAAAISPNVWVAAACVVVSGFGNGIALVCNALFVQRGAPDEMRGRAFTVLMGANFAIVGAAMAVAGPVTNEIGPRWVWGIAAVAVAAAGVVGVALARGVSVRVPEPQPEAAR